MLQWSLKFRPTYIIIPVYWRKKWYCTFLLTMYESRYVVWLLGRDIPEISPLWKSHRWWGWGSHLLSVLITFSLLKRQKFGRYGFRYAISALVFCANQWKKERGVMGQKSPVLGLPWQSGVKTPSSQCSVAAWMGEECGGEWIHIYVWLSPSGVHPKPSQHTIKSSKKKRL